MNSIFGAMGQSALTGLGIYQSSLANNKFQGLSGQMGISLAQQQMANYNAAMMQNTPRWMIDGKVFKSSKEFAEHIWPDSPEDRMVFALRYPD
jgi:2-methylaconitate cis-trans-isomerase PrpF